MISQILGMQQREDGKVLCLPVDNVVPWTGKRDAASQRTTMHLSPPCSVLLISFSHTIFRSRGYSRTSVIKKKMSIQTSSRGLWNFMGFLSLARTNLFSCQSVKECYISLGIMFIYLDFNSNKTRTLSLISLYFAELCSFTRNIDLLMVGACLKQAPRLQKLKIVNTHLWPWDSTELSSLSFSFV